MRPPSSISKKNGERSSQTYTVVEAWTLNFRIFSNGLPYVPTSFGNIRWLLWMRESLGGRVVPNGGITKRASAGTPYCCTAETFPSGTACNSTAPPATGGSWTFCGNPAQVQAAGGCHCLFPFPHPSCKIIWGLPFALQMWSTWNNTKNHNSYHICSLVKCKKKNRKGGGEKN